jgi:hypothetical protein
MELVDAALTLIGKGAAGRIGGLSAGDVVFDEVRMLQAGKFDRKAAFDMTDNPARRLADGDRRADWR